MATAAFSISAAQLSEPKGERAEHHAAVCADPVEADLNV